MRDRLKFMATLGIVVLSGALVVATLALTGGPVHARKEHRDDVRMQDLRAIQQYVSCAAASSTGPLPDRPAPVAGCGTLPRLSDPYTGQRYRYEVLNLRTIRLCADFELPPDPRMQSEDEAIGAGPDCRDMRVWGRDDIADPGEPPPDPPAN